MMRMAASIALPAPESEISRTGRVGKSSACVRVAPAATASRQSAASVKRRRNACMGEGSELTRRRARLAVSGPLPEEVAALVATRERQTEREHGRERRNLQAANREAL